MLIAQALWLQLVHGIEAGVFPTGRISGPQMRAVDSSRNGIGATRGACAVRIATARF